MKSGSLVVYGWQVDEEPYYEDPDRYGIVVSEKKKNSNITTENLILLEETDEWEVELFEGALSVDVLWSDNGLIEECSLENLFEVDSCQIGI